MTDQNDITYLEKIFITPKIAETFLSTMGENYRPLRRLHAESIARAIVNGEWKMNMDTIKFDKNGRLRDGQHRCQAIIIAGIGVWSWVGSNLPEEAIPTLDQNMVRSFRDNVRNMDLPYTSKDLTIAKMIYFHNSYPEYWHIRYNIPKLEMYESAKLVGAIYQELKAVHRCGVKSAILAPLVEALIYYRTDAKRTTRLYEMVHVLKTGKSAGSKDEGALLLRKLSYHSGIMDWQELYEKAQSGVVAFLSGKPIQNLKGVTKTMYPVVIDLKQI